MTGRLVRKLRRPVRLGSLRRTSPISDRWGWDRGTPIDRHFVERFLSQHRADISGDVVEIGDSRYIDRFGVDVRVKHVLDVDPANPAATMTADLASEDALPAQVADCVIVVQTLQYVYDCAAAVRGVHRLLRGGGVALATMPAVSRISRSTGVGSDFWRFTAPSVERLFGDAFGPDVSVDAHGNVLTGIAFLAGLAAEDLRPEELAIDDEYFPVLITARAVKR
ncbi:MAG: class I SAM-dependent methyltransferase [Actinobacteria bacterium]|nr:MAG: class I SAM-dependent methyltransferase [Actinomycetota bacterium]